MAALHLQRSPAAKQLYLLFHFLLTILATSFFFCKNIISTPVFIYLHLAALQKCQMGPLVLQPLAKQGSGPQTLPCLSKDGWFGDFPDGLVVKTLCFRCRGCGFDP